MRERVLITGIGSVSSFGVGAAPFSEAILAGASGIAPIAAFDTAACRSHRAAMIQGFDPAAFIPPMKLRRVDGAGRLALACAKLALDDAGWAPGAGLAGVALGTYAGGLDSTVAYMKGLVKDGAGGVPALLFSNTVQNAPASLCAIEFGLRGPNVTFNQREASSLAAIMFADSAVRSGRAASMLTGGADCVDEWLFKVYDRFHALSPKTAGGEEAARPFDARRNGLILGEGGHLLLLEAGASAQARGARSYGEILGVGGTGSAADVNAWPSEPDGPVRAMAAALDDAGMTADDVAAVFASANGSLDLDATEAAAIRQVFGTRRVPVVSLKGAIGESSASGAAGIVAGALALAAGRLPPTAGWSVPDPRCDLDLSTAARDLRGDVFLINSIASGGTSYSAVVRAHVH